jgi:hypothetical protein
MTFLWLICFSNLHKYILLESKSPAGWQSAPALNPKMRRGLGVSLVSWKSGKKHKNAQGFRMVRATGA